MDQLEGVLDGQKIAYFSMEIGLNNEIPTYNGGLGVLAGDTIRSSTDLNVPLVGVTLISKKGYFRQKLDEAGRQTEHPEDWDPNRYMKMLSTHVSVNIGGREVKIGAWLYENKSPTGLKVPVILLDTDLEVNDPQDREITHHLYGGDQVYRLKQEIVLGMGGVRMLDALGFNIRKYHMNEGHSSLLTIELLNRDGMNSKKVKQLCVFTTHTPVEAGHDKFSFDIVDQLITDEEIQRLLRKYGGKDWKLNMTLLGLNLSNFINGVAKRHRDISAEMFPGYKIEAITNGVHSYTWTCQCFRELYDRYIPGWANEPELLVRVHGITDSEIWNTHMKAKKQLIDYVNRLKNTDLDYDSLTLGFARRSTGYKRPKFIFQDIKRLKRINSKGRIQIIFAGKAHPRDHEGKKLIEEIFKHIKELENEIKIVYLENYDMELASKITSGVDVWLNTPQRPLEASGTSGMKAAHNGVVNFSVLAGWWIEGCIEGVTGWSIGPHPSEDWSPEETETLEKDDFYNKLEYVIIPTYYQARNRWIRIMNNSIGMIAYYFNSHRMVHHYVTNAYL
ncbi:alpha-glucan phosphorylase [Methanosalsum zhilinae DSM 4017]|uniref:Alpha-glucan phosphorylase n=1 Tax=Methanosalsum zhilinae (strain DSM 4017 / NBRC 107636 / OCM 62 / WeN5) TaxID=679901 RepID=F7XM05_METZD|nr:alpha-glucan family phosphorylase [Methanosalsum zhilinae]AEH60938.1 alpha-glucan phosphorylase [Methanosalsum zhilinae DSM 4017]